MKLISRIEIFGEFFDKLIQIPTEKVVCDVELSCKDKPTKSLEHSTNETNLDINDI